MHKILKNAQFEILDEARPCAHEDQSDRFNQLAINFLTSNMNGRSQKKGKINFTRRRRVSAQIIQDWRRSQTKR
jgi:hypothetical protein